MKKETNKKGTMKKYNITASQTIYATYEIEVESKKRNRSRKSSHE
jgi:hypothetical protein